MAAEVALAILGLALAAQSPGRSLLEAPWPGGAIILDSGMPGPLVAIAAGLHGDETSGVEAARALGAGAPPRIGVLLVIPVANPAAVEAGMRTGPSGLDLNRLFPGGAGSLEAEAAARLFEVARRSDFVIDLHESGPAWTDTPGPTLVVNGPAAPILLGLLDGLTERGFSGAGSPPAGSLSAELARAGIATVTVEIPAVLPAKERLELQLRAVGEILALLGMAP